MVNHNGRKARTVGFGVRKTEADVPCPHCHGTGRVRPKDMTIGTRFLGCRQTLGETQEKIAPQLKVTRSQLANIEADRGRPGLETLVLAADAFGVSVDYLLGRQP